ncbi:hypothetical protein H2203_008031 [Taxawa tesnikishii (nom. ined.)]|nr:hypothetical protein H2203_008031 [Dothideales sp. JES 119]
MSPNPKIQEAQPARRAPTSPHLPQEPTTSQADEQTAENDFDEENGGFDKLHDAGRGESQAMLDAVTAVAFEHKNRDEWPDQQRKQIEKDKAEVSKLFREQQATMNARETERKRNMRSLLTSILSVPIPEGARIPPVPDQQIHRTIQHPLQAHGALLIQQSDTLIEAWHRATTATSNVAFPDDITKDLTEDKARLVKALGYGKIVAQDEIDTMLQHRRADKLRQGCPLEGTESGEAKKAMAYFSRKRKNGEGNKENENGRLDETLRRVEGAVRKMVKTLPA